MGFLVGGCVRDLLIGREPKDFDVATDALPEQVRKLFRNCRLVGRRFRLAHVFFGRDIIEVATFRAASAPAPGEEPLGDAELADDPDLLATAPQVETLTEPDVDLDADAVLGRFADDSGSERMLDETGRIIRDNVYGTIDADVWRRDLTVNALYYNIADFSIWDYVGGFGDVAARKLKLIGDPETRFREDPVRMLRVAPIRGEARFCNRPGDGGADRAAERIARRCSACAPLR